eukprot:2329780-Ditylum_brightwellii.AAC.1
MISVDRDIIIGANTEGNAWASPKDLPTGETFNKAFAMKQEMQNDKPGIIMFTEIKRSWK